MYVLYPTTEYNTAVKVIELKEHHKLYMKYGVNK